MSSLLLPRRFYSQPQGAVQIDWSNPLTQDLRFAVLPHMGVMLQANQTVVGKPRGQTNAPTPLGMAASWDAGTSTSGLKFGLQVNLLSPDQFSGFALAAPTSESKVKPFFSIRGGTNQLLFGANLGTGGSQQAGQLGVFTASPNYAVKAGVIDGALHAFGFSWWPGVYRELFIDGNPQSATINGSTVFSSDGTEEFGVGKLADLDNTSYIHNNPLLLTCGWNRSLSADEHAALSANPWQIFRVSE